MQTENDRRQNDLFYTEIGYSVGKPLYTYGKVSPAKAKQMYVEFQIKKEEGETLKIAL